MAQAQRFVKVHAAEPNLYTLGRHLVRARPYRDLRIGAIEEWGRAVASDLELYSIGLGRLTCLYSPG